ncbi:MAG: hypothetical protein JF616_04765 [Fibrobacteres bacterium]|jgi:hypothetical protein|nr:hypothetical protein [Fibrobacterota bacterium]
MRNRALPFLSFALLAACAPSNPYHPLSSGEGYSEVSVAPNRWQISFHGTSDQDELAAKKYALVRAAEIAKGGSFPYFRLEEGKTKANEDRETVRETDAVRENNYPGQPWAGKRTRSRTVSRTERRPVVRITVDLEKDRCGECLETDAVLNEAAATGVLGK